MIWALAALAAGAYPLSEWLRRPVAEARAAAPGAMAALPSGCTHYRWHGPADGPVVLCLHGISTGGWFMDSTAETLARLGYRVLVPDLYGRGLSDRPPGRQSSAMLIGQIDELLAAQGVTGRLGVLGFSMGGALATAFAAARPDLVERLILIAPAGLGLKMPRAVALARALPGLADWLVRVPGGALMRLVARRYGRARALPAAVIEAQVAETRYRGFLPAMLSSLRGLLAEDLAPAHRRLAAAGMPVLAIWAEGDELIAPAAAQRLAALNPGAVQITLAGASHVLPITHAAEVARALAGVLPRR
ncbi:alpha/beta hydrolase [Rhodovulum tesquicola]|uniref:alpha/beta fold hydrolase n=1 Tax=Rhodovulum tesquicola TaxID=540254 RepID=UPI0020973D2C|nr:alpha/beta fold hydrolase [Rhodovulum tesquicola]MCO8144751.1 alpha/beta hydrolase [Rhodovulum tesquicola]